MPKDISPETMRWAEIGKMTDIPQRGARVVKASGVCIAVFRTARDEVFALEDRCPHKGGPLSNGIVHGNAVTCPLHNLVIDLSSGASEQGKVEAIPVRISGDTLFLQLQDIC